MNDPLKSHDPVAAKRGMDRDSLLLKAVLRFPNAGEEREVRIRNLSAGGLMAEVPVRVVRGEPVEINLRSIGWISGHVAWVTEGRLGIAFDHPINPKDARKPVGTTELEIPPYLKKLNNPAAPSKLRRL
jgi:PilZ domain